MKMLYLMRHGKSAWDDADHGDHERPLAPRGCKAAAAVGRHLAKLEAHPQLVLCSDARRTSDTLDLTLEHLDAKPTIEREGGLYLCGPRVLLERIKDVPGDVDSLLVMAHNPDLHAVALALAGHGDDDHHLALKMKFPTAACAVFRLDIARWRDIDAARAVLQEFILPRKLPA
jgi:phosphohistidine phosphatase